MTIAQANLFQTQLMVEELCRRGADHVILCPGSRSSPLALAVALEKRVQSIVHYDERGAGYYAVGYARATGKPAVVMTTSGTAAANLFPAIIEASMDNLPLLAVTADRPPELHGCGANQTIDQTDLFRNYARSAALLQCPDERIDPTDVLSAISGAYSCALRSSQSPGPAHINCPFREPLVPSPENIRPLGDTIEREYPELADWFHSGKTYGTDLTASPELDAAVLDSMANTMRQAKRGLLVIGYLRSEIEQQAAIDLSRRLKWPTLADITSGLSGIDEPHIIRHYDLILASEQFADNHVPDAILHIGGRFTSKRLLQFIEHSRPTHYLFNAGHDVVFDPARAVTSRTNYDTSAFCKALGRRIMNTVNHTSWLQNWNLAANKTSEVVEEHCGVSSALTEPSLAWSLSRRLDPRAALFLAGSMPIRDMDMFAAFNQPTNVSANRGASGIDGTIASACGYAAGLDRPVVLTIGDQAFLHDLNSLALVSKSKQAVVIVVVNNNGGRIFEMLPVAEHRELLDRFFVAPHGLTFDKIAETFGIQYVKVHEIGEFTKACNNAADSRQSIIIEAVVEPTLSLRHRAQLIQATQAAVDMV